MKILLTGATGFVGHHLFHALDAMEYEVLCGTRQPNLASSKMPRRSWIHFDTEDIESARKALCGCDAAFYLIHGMGQDGDYAAREAKSAENFVRAATECGVRRIVYLGGVMPKGSGASKHLRSRQVTGEILRGGSPSTIENRAAMVIGDGSVSWTMVRNLAARLPAMLLPRWLKNCSYPVAIDDVVWALLASLLCDAKTSKVFELPGPEKISHKDVLQRVAAVLGYERPMMSVPILSPKLSSYWIALVTGVKLDLAKELVEGLRFDLEPQQEILWDHLSREPMSLETAAKEAILDSATGTARWRERMKSLGQQLAIHNPWDPRSEVMLAGEPFTQPKLTQTEVQIHRYETVPTNFSEGKKGHYADDDNTK